MDFPIKHKIIFLDIDETLSCLSNTIRCRRLGLAPYSFEGFNPISVGLLRELTELDTSIKIVLSSTWRLHYQSDQQCIEEFKLNMKEHYNWDNFPIIGRTCNHFKKPNGKWSCRGDEIKKWLDNNDIYWSHYVIIDDSNDMLPIQKKNHFVRVDYHEGFNFRDFKKCLQILEIQSNYLTA